MKKQIGIFQLVPFFNDWDKLHCNVSIVLLWICSVRFRHAGVA